MGALRGIAAALALIAAILSFGSGASEPGASEAFAAPVLEQWRPIARDAAERFGLPTEWVLRVIAAESGGRTALGGKPITSHAGAMGLMQIMPATWAMLRAQYRLGADPHDPRDNIVAGTAYLRAMYDRFGYPGLFGAYNAGPGRYGDYAERGRPLPRETRDYIAKITGVAPRPAGSFERGRRAGFARSDQSPHGVDPIFLRRTGASSDDGETAARADRAEVRRRADQPSRAPVPAPYAEPVRARSAAVDAIFALRKQGGEPGE